MWGWFGVEEYEEARILWYSTSLGCFELYIQEWGSGFALYTHSRDYANFRWMHDSGRLSELFSDNILCWFHYKLFVFY